MNDICMKALAMLPHAQTACCDTTSQICHQSEQYVAVPAVYTCMIPFDVFMVPNQNLMTLLAGPLETGTRQRRVHKEKIVNMQTVETMNGENKNKLK